MLTRLEIVNAMLAATGVAPVTTNDTQHPFYVGASNKLSIVNAEIQGKGWWFNKTIRTIRQNTAGEVILPDTALHVDPVAVDAGIVMRGNRMYDQLNGSYVIGADLQVVYVENVPIEHLPPTAVSYIMADAVYKYYVDKAGEPMKVQEYRVAAMSAFVDFKAEHMRNADVNWFNGMSYAAIARTSANRRLPT